MAWNLTDRTKDLEYTKILHDKGKDVIEELFPIFPQEYSPMIEKDFDFIPYEKQIPDFCPVSSSRSI